MTQPLSFLNEDLLSQPQLVQKALCALPEDCCTRLFESIWNNAVGEMQGCAVQSNHQLVQLLLG